MQDYKVVFIGDNDLPDGVNWVIVKDHDGRMIAFLKWSRMTPTLLEEAWAAAYECQVGPFIRRWPRIVQQQYADQPLMLSAI